MVLLIIPSSGMNPFLIYKLSGKFIPVISGNFKSLMTVERMEAVDHRTWCPPPVGVGF
jgi:hypothetical protein